MKENMKGWNSREQLGKEIGHYLKLMNLDISNVGVIPHFSTGQNLSNKILT